jgi:pimeloyl-ACP methyl ester carboxylesterase
MIKTITLIILGFLLVGCLKLDDNLYNADQLESYQLDEFDGEQDFVLDASYSIPSNLVNIFTLNSQMSSESSPVSIYAIYIGDMNKITTDTVIMYCHGNKSHMDFYWQRAKLLAHIGGKNNYGVLMIDYRGYGMSGGTPSEEGMYTDVNVGLDWLSKNGLSNERLIIYGFSLGTAPATELTANTRVMIPSKLILEAPFASAAVMVQDASVLALPASFVTSLEIDNAEEVKKITQPFLWIHGTMDQKNSFSTHGQVVYNNYKGIHKESLIVQGADHSNVPVIFGFQNYCNTIDAFIKLN